MHFASNSAGHLCPIKIESVPRQVIGRVIIRLSLFNRVGVNIVGSAIGLILHSKNDTVLCLQHFSGEKPRAYGLHLGMSRTDLIDLSAY